ncbi:chitosanase [Kitasatospora sp. NPDC058965]|uniref:chitosanase n=1 Tax=Kitasatospora sp. NPDC058965 TaxID=3346682 RepID=UPI003679E68D
MTTPAMTIPTTRRRRPLARRGPALAAAVLVATLAVPAIGHADSSEWLTGDQRRYADQMISVFENSTTELQYAYAENIHDGRGVTAGRAGFTTNDGDALKVVRAYTAVVPGNPLAAFVPELQRLADTGSGSTDGLPEADYIAAWQQAAQDPAFCQVQDDQVDQRYFNPAMQDADQLGLHTPLARAELYDAAIQHGLDSSYDGLLGLIARTNQQVGTPDRAGETAWLGAFFAVRTDDLTNPANSATQAEWSKSVDRVAAVKRVADSGNYALTGPYTLTAFGTSYTIQ